MVRKIFITALLISSCIGFTQDNLSEVLKKYNKESVPYISVQEFFTQSESVIILDAREKAEYDVSHINNAIFVGYDKFDIKSTNALLKNKNKPIVVYCSIGVRSEDIAEELKASGYKNVYNLYGGIFEWKNKDLPLVNNDNQPTDSIHAYSKRWAKWLNKGIKVYE